MSLRFEGFMAFNSGYIYNLQTSERFQNLTRTQDAQVFTVKDLEDLMDVIEAGAISEHRLEEISDTWYDNRYIPTEAKGRYANAIARASIPEHYKILLENIVDILASGQASTMKYLDRMGLIAGNLYFLQHMMAGFNARLLDMTFLTHFKQDEKILKLMAGEIAHGITFGLSHRDDTSLCTFYTLSVENNVEFISLGDEEEERLLDQYLALHEKYIDVWDNVPNSIPLDFEFHKKLREFSEAKQVPDRVGVKATPVFFYGHVLSSGKTFKMGGSDGGGVVVLDDFWFRKVQKFHLVEILDSLRSTFLAFLDVKLINSNRTIGIVPVAYNGEIFLIVEINQLTSAGAGSAFPQRLGVVYHLDRVLQAGGTSLSELVKAHISLLPGLLGQVDLWMRDEDQSSPEIPVLESYIRAKLLELVPMV
ncbi:MAG: hypothetical protein ACTSU5_12275 [Promethearchaeota archaeon]